ncbi:MAG: M24 family metallopeptidase, partial [Jatrophihabitans sp.]
MGRRPERIQLKSADQIAVMREAGLVVAHALEEMRVAAAPGVSTADLDDIARGVLAKAGATSSFLGYDIGSGPYPGVICASVNDQVVHGIPSASQKLRDGDLISVDFGAIVDGWHGDAAISIPIGEVSAEVTALSDACRESLWDGLAVARAGGRLTDISHAVEQSIRAAGAFGIVAGYGGHGIGTA